MSDELFDSDIMIDYLNKVEPIKSYVEASIRNHTSYISVVTYAELRAGWSDQEEPILKPLITEAFTIEPLTLEIAELAGKFRSVYRVNVDNRKIPLPDHFIAATAMVHNFQLVTRNIKDYPIAGISINKQFMNLK